MTARVVEVTASDQFAGRLEQNGPARYSFAYLRHDVPALHLAGSKRWWPPRTLLAFGTTHCSLKPAQARSVLSEVAAALQAELPHLEAAAPRFPDVAVAMCEAWQSSLVTLNRAL